MLPCIPNKARLEESGDFSREETQTTITNHGRLTIWLAKPDPLPCSPISRISDTTPPIYRLSHATIPGRSLLSSSHRCHSGSRAVNTTKESKARKVELHAPLWG